MNTDHSALNDMISTLNDGRAFYQDAATKVAREDLKRLFERMAKTKMAIVNDMQNTVVFTGAEPSDEGSFSGGMRKAYAGLLARLSPSSNSSRTASSNRSAPRSRPPTTPRFVRSRRSTCRKCRATTTRCGP
jgi:uncharacterized protein (TIGR02284 family)